MYLHVESSIISAEEVCRCGWRGIIGTVPSAHRAVRRYKKSATNLIKQTRLKIFYSEYPFSTTKVICVKTTAKLSAREIVDSIKLNRSGY